ncbi:MAG: hypothetical protein C0596_11740 [Marinilabiliales bacterium]|nr:MAG: hypothetical protein C0596_11740 [Marinilabiliales bacterium]
MEVKNWILIFVFAGFLLIPAKQSLADKIDEKPPCHTITLTGSNVSCFGGTNGSVSLAISGGSGNFTISWSTGQTGGTSLSNLDAGYYDVSVLDNETGCVAFDIYNVTEPDLLESSIITTDVFCFGNSTGNIDLSVIGGTQPYNITWSNSITTEDNPNISAGDYFVTISDSHGCTLNNNATIYQPEMALGASNVVTELLCYDDSNASIDVSVWGGTPPYTYNWNSYTYTSQDLANIPAGTYNLIIKDYLNCQTTQNVLIENPELLEMIGSDTDNLCFGIPDGSITLNVTGGTEPYSYVWADTDLMLSYSTPVITELYNNEYFVTVSDANGCSLTQNFEITSPTEILTSITGSNVSALGGTDGQIDLTVSGGVSPYSFDWSNSVTSEDNPDVPAGEYIVTVTDDNSCTTTESIVINEPMESLSFSYLSKNVTCHGSVDGEIFAYASGGVAPYLYTWSTGSNLSYIVELSAGTYSLTIEDSNGVEYSGDVVIEQPEALSFTHTYLSPSCNGFNDGSIDLTVNGGTPPYRYYWYDPEFALAGLTQDISNVGSGSFSVEVIDTMGCIGEYSVNVNQPEPMILSLEEGNIQCSGGDSGSITTIVEGGTFPYTYLWSNSETSANLTDLPIGHYSLTVSDANLCMAYLDAYITEPEPIIIELTAYKTSCVDQDDGYITSFIDGGSGGYTMEWSNSQTSEDIYELAPGQYTLEVTDIFGCVATQSAIVEVNEVACLNIPTSFSPNGDGINDDWVINNLYLYTDCHMQIFNKWGTMVYESEGYSTNWDGTYM